MNRSFCIDCEIIGFNDSISPASKNRSISRPSALDSTSSRSLSYFINLDFDNLLNVYINPKVLCLFCTYSDHLSSEQMALYGIRLKQLMQKDCSSVTHSSLLLLSKCFFLLHILETSNTSSISRSFAIFFHL